MGESNLARFLFLKALAAIYLVCFTCFYMQIPELWGNSGLLPASWFLGRVEEHLKRSKVPDSFLDKFSNVPTLAWLKDLNFTALLGKDEAENWLYLCALIGIATSALALFKGKLFMNSAAFFFMFLCYLSLQKLGQTFMSFQWDMLLLEAGFLAVFYANLTGDYTTQSAWSVAIRELYRWSCFRFMMGSGHVKLLSQCPTWWSLTALEHHLQSQPLPK